MVTLTDRMGIINSSECALFLRGHLRMSFLLPEPGVELLGVLLINCHGYRPTLRKLDYF